MIANPGVFIISFVHVLCNKIATHDQYTPFDSNKNAGIIQTTQINTAMHQNNERQHRMVHFSTRIK